MDWCYSYRTVSDMTPTNTYSEDFGLEWATERSINHIKLNWISEKQFQSKGWYRLDMFAWPFVVCYKVFVCTCTHLHFPKQVPWSSPVLLVNLHPSWLTLVPPSGHLLLVYSYRVPAAVRDRKSGQMIKRPICVVARYVASERPDISLSKLFRWSMCTYICMH